MLFSGLFNRITQTTVKPLIVYGVFIGIIEAACVFRVIPTLKLECCQAGLLMGEIFVKVSVCFQSL